MPYSARQTLAATEFLARLAHLHELNDRDARRPGREDDAKTATHAFFDQFNIPHDTPASVVRSLALWITNPEAHVFVGDFPTAHARCIAGRALHVRCGRSRRDPRHIAPVIPALADLSNPDVEVVHADDLGAQRGVKP